MPEQDFPPQFADVANALIATFADGDSLLFTDEVVSVTQESQRRFLAALEHAPEGNAQGLPNTNGSNICRRSVYYLCNPVYK